MWCRLNVKEKGSFMLHRKNWVLIGMMLCSASAVMAASTMFIGSEGTMSAEVTFTASGTDLLVSLKNTSTLDALMPADILTAVFFESQVPLTLTRVSAIVPSGSIVLFGTTDPGGVVGGEWAYRSGLTTLPDNLRYGISSEGFGLFNPQDRFPGSNLQGGVSPTGLEYGITTAGDDPSTGHADVTGKFALIQNQVDFVLSGLPVGFNPYESITDVMFQYGTALSHPHCRGVFIPEPAALSLLAVGSLFAFRRRSVGA